MGYACINGDGNAASILLTVLDTGDVSPLCGDCIPAACIGMLEQITGQPWAPVGGWGTDEATDEPTDDPGATPAGPSPEAPAPSTPGTAPGPEEAEEEEPEGHDQLAEDAAVYAADVAEALRRDPAPY